MEYSPIGVWGAGYPGHVLLHLRRAVCDSEAGCCSRAHLSAEKGPGNQFYDKALSPECVTAKTITLSTAVSQWKELLLSLTALF